MKVLSRTKLREICPVKWHPQIPSDGISFGVADIDFEGPEGVVDYLKSTLTEDFAFYQNQLGLKDTLSHVTEFLISKNIIAQETNIQIIPGTMLGIYASMKWASRRNQKILCLGPLYEPIHRHASDNGNKVDWLEINKYGIDEEQLKLKVNRDLDLIAINSPSNPSGFVYNEVHLKLIRDLCQDNDVMCFSDELYEPLIFKKKHISVGSIDGLRDRSIILYGFSKAYGLAGYRSGFMYLGDRIKDELHKIIEAQLVSPSPIASLVCSFALNNPKSILWKNNFRKAMKENTEFASNYFRDHDIPCETPDSTFFVFPDIQKNDTEFVPRLLKNQGVQVVEGSKFGPMGLNHIRVNCATSKERLTEGIKRIIAELN